MSADSTSTDRRWTVWATTPVLLLIGTLLALAGGSTTRPLWDSWPLLVWVWIAGVNVLAWVPAFILRSERFYDLTGSFSFISSMIGLFVIAQPGLPATLLMLAIVLWSGRMAWFLVGRIHRQGKDGRFDDIKTDPWRFLNTWLMQALWAFICVGPVVAAVDAMPGMGWTPWLLAGLLVWTFGFAIEVIADEQKRRFRKQHPDGKRFITRGLWAVSRHPNYVGEIILWTGLCIAAIPVFSGWQWAFLITPVFVFVLLRFVSGVPLLEQRADEKWGGQTEYEAYKKRTPVLFPVPWKKA